jgi:SAM-dependent methyltransferase
VIATAIARHLITWAAVLAGAAILLRQCRKPAGWPGRLFLSIMNRSHAGVTGWGLSHVRVEPAFTVLDVGCGGGRTIRTLAAAASAGRVYGVDYSPTSVAAARRTNAASIAGGRVDVRQGTVSRLAFADDTFDLVTAVETHYYWPDLGADLREIRRVLKPGGRLALIAETYRNSRFTAVYLPAMTLLRARYLSADQHREALAAAGYTDIAVTEHRAKGWICAVGRKPPIAAA